MDIKKISVIMPVYNCEKYLRQAIESILNQTYKDFEFIIINDGSIDNSFNIIKEYQLQDGRIITISRENKGLIYSLNEGISLASGKYIARMDGDDIALPERFEKQVEFLEHKKDVDVIGTHIYAFGNEDIEKSKKIEERFNVLIDEINMEKIIFDDIVICHPSSMIRREVLDKLGGYSYKYTCAEDYDLWIRALKFGFKLSTVNEKLTRYRLHNESKSYNDDLENNTLLDYINIKLDYLEKYLCVKQINCFIWGASNGGRLVKKILTEKFYNINVIGYIDKYKIGKFEGISIYNPDEIKNIKEFNYIFIATTPGKIECEKFLKSLKYKEFHDFASLL